MVCKLGEANKLNIIYHFRGSAGLESPLWENSTFLAELDPCKNYEKLMLTVFENEWNVNIETFNYDPEISIRNHLIRSICISSSNMFVYKEDMFGLEKLFVKNEDSTATEIKRGTNKNIVIGKSRTILLFFRFCQKDYTRSQEIELQCCTQEMCDRKGNEQNSPVQSDYTVNGVKDQSKLMDSPSLSDNTVMLIVGLVIGTVLVLSIVAFFRFCLKKIRNQRESEESVYTNNPLYGIDYDNYYAETKMEETNPHYDAYYKDDYYTTNITDNNELYGQDEKLESS